jgi:haloalkane dehalogenase
MQTSRTPMAEELNIGWFVQGGCRRQLSDEVRAGYDAPFPADEYCAGPRAMPGLVPTSPDDPAVAANRGPSANQIVEFLR